MSIESLHDVDLQNYPPSTMVGVGSEPIYSAAQGPYAEQISEAAATLRTVAATHLAALTARKLDKDQLELNKDALMASIQPEDSLWKSREAVWAASDHFLTLQMLAGSYDPPQMRARP